MADIMDKFRITEKDKALFKEQIISLFDKNFEMYEQNYQQIFKGMPYEVLENMSQEQAGSFVKEVMEQAAKMITQTITLSQKGLQDLLKDEDKMKELRENFAKKVMGEAKATVDVPDVPKEMGGEDGGCKT